MNEECNKVCREPMTKERLYEKINCAVRQSEISIATKEGEFNGLMTAKRFLDEYFWDQENETVKESIPYLMHKEMGVPLSECQKAYDVAIEYLRNKAEVKG